MERKDAGEGGRVPRPGPSAIIVNRALNAPRLALTGATRHPLQDLAMNALTPLIELASNRSLDLFFRVGQGYVARAAHEAGFRQGGHGVSPLGVQTRAEARIVSTLGPVPCERRLNAWPVGGGTSRPLARPT